MNGSATRKVAAAGATALGIALIWQPVSNAGPPKPRPNTEACVHAPSDEVSGRCARGSSGGVARGDFNGDGLTDLVIGTRLEDVGTVRDAGVIEVLYGSQSGLCCHQLWHQDTAGVPDVVETGDHFGSAVASGDFNADGYSDLAVGAPYEDVGFIADAGQVTVFLGSPSGLTATGSHVIQQGAGKYDGTAEAGDRFGFSLVWGAFDANPPFAVLGDLAIGVPGQSVGGFARAGAVQVVYGICGCPGGGGLTGDKEQTWTENTPGVAGSAGPDEFFGRNLAAADFGNGVFHDLVVSVWEDPNQFVGAVHVLYGGSAGLSTTASQIWREGDNLPPNTGAQTSSLGAALAGGRFNDDPYADLAIGAPDYQPPSSGAGNGRVYVVYGSAGGLNPIVQQTWEPAVQVDPETAGSYGSSLAAGNFNGDGQQDLVVGDPRRTLRVADGYPADVVQAGRVEIVFGSSAGLTPTGRQAISGFSPGMQGAFAYDGFGDSLSAWNFGNSPETDLAIGVPFADVHSVRNAGALYVLYGTSEGLSTFGSFLTQHLLGLTSEPGDLFGSVLY